ncbi:MAG: DUF4469 domain-containing protein [Spirochaetes bacterium]|nr:DUF4469 domain-containing protein [Spirochaetota bacterium]MBU1080328.1 DUF4469 domain-containing protein [Spirochaetota bacterium]
MALLVSTRENTLVGRTEAWRFHARHSGTVQYDRLLDIMARSRTTLSKPDLVAAVQLLSETVSSLVADGMFVKTPLGDYYLSAVGTAKAADDRFEPRTASSGHGLRLRFRPARAAEAAILESVRFRKDDEAPRRYPAPQELEPVHEASRDPGAGPGGSTRGSTRGSVGRRSLAPGGFARLSGRNLRFDEADERLGVFLVPLGGGEPRRCSAYAEIRPSLVIFQSPPDLLPGDYALAARTATKAGTVREGRLAGGLSVEG